MVDHSWQRRNTCLGRRRRGGQEGLCELAKRLIEQEQEHAYAVFRKYKAGLAMSRPKISPKKLQEIREFAAQWGKIVARRAFGESGPGLDVDFQAMEEIAAAAAAGLTEGTFTTLLEQQTQALGPEEPCPDCEQLCPVERE